MRLASLCLLLLSLGSIQLPWVLCAEEHVHLDLGHHGDDHHDGDAQHERLEWSAVPHAAAVPATIPAQLLVAEGVCWAPCSNATLAVPEARAVAPPLADPVRTTVLLL